MHSYNLKGGFSSFERKPDQTVEKIRDFLRMKLEFLKTVCFTLKPWRGMSNPLYIGTSFDVYCGVLIPGMLTMTSYAGP